MSNTVTIDLANNHLAGMFVQTTTQDIDECIAKLKSLGWGKLKIRKVVKMLKRQSRQYAPIIAAGGTYFDGHEIMDKETFDADLLWIAVYDHVAENKPIKFC